MIKVLCGGRFNFPHLGHEYFLKKAKSYGDYLIVVIANDSHNTKYAERTDAAKRKEYIENLGMADEVVVGDKEDFFKVVEKYKPQIIALGWDQKLPFEQNKLEDLGIRIVIIGKSEE